MQLLTNDNTFRLTENSFSQRVPPHTSEDAFFFVANLVFGESDGVFAKAQSHSERSQAASYNIGPLTIVEDVF